MLAGMKNLYCNNNKKKELVIWWILLFLQATDWKWKESKKIEVYLNISTVQPNGKIHVFALQRAIFLL